jgi:hypothetical protein
VQRDNDFGKKPVVDRREFLKLSGAGFCTLAIAPPEAAHGRIIAVDDPLRSYPDRTWEDFYRKEFSTTRGDAQGTHFTAPTARATARSAYSPKMAR